MCCASLQTVLASTDSSLTPYPCGAFSNTDVVSFQMHRLFKQKVSNSKSAVKISDQVDRNNKKLIEAVFWSSLLDNVFKENLKNDPELRYCYCTINKIDQIKLGVSRAFQGHFILLTSIV